MQAKWIVMFGCLISFAASPMGNAQEATKSATAAAKSPAQEKLKSIRASAIKYLQTQGQANDGGFFYKLPAEADLESADRNAPAGGLRSYGSMTYSGLKSMIYAGLTKNDPRVEAAAKWIAMHYSLQENPGMGKAGLFYYYHTFGVALNTLGDPTIMDGDGKARAWRSELIEHLASIQKSDGSWQNDNQQWFESDKNLSTAFALLALAYCQE